MWQHPPVTYEVNIHKKRKVTVQNVICTQGLNLIYSSFVFKIHWYRNTFFIHQYNKKDNSMWSSIFWETHWYCLLGVFVIDPVLQSSLLALEHDSLLDNTKVQRSNRKALSFKYVQLERKSCVWAYYSTVNITDLYVEISGEQRVTTRRV